MSNSTYIEEEAPKSYWQEQYEKLKAEIESFPKIEGWVARDFEGLVLFKEKPNWSAKSRYWYGCAMSILDDSLFLEVESEGEPLEVEITIKDKKLLK